MHFTPCVSDSVSNALFSSHKSSLCFVLLLNYKQRGDKNWSRGGDGVHVVALREVVNPRMDSVHGDGVVVVGSPYFGVDPEELGRRRVNGTENWKVFWD
ncbi:hypothetical protein M0R45_001641 [Rubus argutus]|uniref:Uncharacterized protein n=1 Tax=Rubus argutus TaxID=59490 RepID=A0AAW1VLJ0_RUBAR